MQPLIKGLIILFALALANCSPVTRCPTSSPQEARKAQEALADFAVNLFKNVSSRDENKNQVFSPVSIALGLALLERGANGKTREEIKRTLLEASSSSEDVLNVYVNLQERLEIDEEKTKLNIANGLFQDNGLELKDDYVNIVKNCFKSEVDKVDFKRVEETRQKVNRFVSQKTNQRIPELFKKGDLRSEDRFVLANAIYFKASFETSFNKASTDKDTFFRRGREQDKQTVDFMRQTTSLRHSSTNELDALELPYQHQDLALYVVLPKARDGLRDLEKRLTGTQLRDIISRLSQKRVNVQLPKFNVRAPIDLKNILTNMGLETLFSDSADFGQITNSNVKLDKGVHEAYLSVDENGTEGAAATAFSGRLRGSAGRLHEEQETSFKADHPFLYAVVHKQTGAIIFLGKINSIEQGE